MSERRLGHCKLCELADFADPELRELIRDVYASDLEYFGEPDFPTGREYRKYWEVAMQMTEAIADRVRPARLEPLPAPGPSPRAVPLDERCTSP